MIYASPVLVTLLHLPSTLPVLLSPVPVSGLSTEWVDATIDVIPVERLGVIYASPLLDDPVSLALHPTGLLSSLSGYHLRNVWACSVLLRCW